MTARPPEAVAGGLGALIGSVLPADPGGEREAGVRTRLDSLAKPPGSLGRLEELALRLAVAQARNRPRAERKAVLIFAGDHGVCAERVSAYRSEATAQLCRAYVAGRGVINALARRAGAEVRVVDVGVDHDFACVPGLLHRKVARGTRNLAREPAMTPEEAERAILVGSEAVAELGEVDLLAVGEVGIGNTTAAAAIAALLTGAPGARLAGRGSGIGDGALRRKAKLIEAVVERQGDRLDPLEILAAAGGFELAALTGAILAAAGRRIPVILDGFATGVSASLAVGLAAPTRDYLIAAHRSAEPGHSVILDRLGIAPLLAWDLRLGEGSGAALALPLAEAACALLSDVATSAEAGVAPALDEQGIR